MSSTESTATVTLSEFLLARIAEDEAIATAAVAHTRWAVGDFDEPSVHGIAHASWENTEGDAWPNMVHIARHDPARVLAECEAKRRIVAGYDGLGGDPWAIALLAAVYSDHPDYREIREEES